MSSGEKQPLIINEKEVPDLLPWVPLTKVVEQALYSISNTNDNKLASAFMPPRTITEVREKNGLLFSMPAYVRNLSLDGRTYNTLACKLVTSFSKNQERKEPLPNIMGNVFVFDENTGDLECIMGGNTITARRTGAASSVATRALCKNKKMQYDVLAVLGPGVQGRAHAVALQANFKFKKIHIFNRSQINDTICKELKDQISDAEIIFLETAEHCVKDADVIVTATYSSEPIVQLEWIKPNVHINAIGAGQNHHSELSESIYRKAQVYVDTMEGAKHELAGLADMDCPILGEIGEILLKMKEPPDGGITVYHNMGMAVLDAAAARLVVHNHEHKTKRAEIAAKTHKPPCLAKCARKTE